MAGIGFELKNLFAKRGFIMNAPAYFLVSLITVGPTVCCIIMIVALQFFIRSTVGGMADSDAMVIIIIYCFMFSLIIASPMYLMQVRYVADALYKNERRLVLPSLYGGFAIAVPLGVILFAPIIFFSTINIVAKFLTIALMAELIFSWIMIAYTAALKRFHNIMWSFLTGIFTLLLLAFLFLNYTTMHPLNAILLASNIGFFIIDAWLMYAIRQEFPTKESSKNIFHFLKYGDSVGSLITIGLFNIIGVFAHQIIMWFSDLQMITERTIVHAPTYDIPVFAAYFTVLVTQINFILLTETEFYSKYRSYFTAILYGGSLADINVTRTEMREVIQDELKKLTEVQALISLMAILIGPPIMEIIGFDTYMVHIYNIGVVGFFIYTISFIYSTMLLYFDDRRGAAIVSVVYALSTIILTIGTLFLGRDFYCYGLPIGALIAYFVAFRRMRYYYENVDSFIFCSQPLFFKERIGGFSKFANALNKFFGEDEDEKDSDNGAVDGAGNDDASAVVVQSGNG